MNGAPLGASALGGLLAFSRPVGAAPPVEFTPAEVRRVLTFSPLPDPPADPTNEYADNSAAAALGQRIFFDPAFSANGKISCATCHDPNHGFSDEQPLARGLGVGTRRSMSLWNVAYNRWYFRDGRSDSLWAQASQPLEHPAEQGLERRKVVERIAGDASLRSAYERVIGALPAPPINDRDAARVLANSGKCLAAYERKLVTRAAPFDRFVAAWRAEGPEAPPPSVPGFSSAAQRGLKLFVGRGNCRSCHSGPNFTDGEFHSLRIPPPDGGAPRDAGRLGGIERLLHDPFNAAGEFSAARDGPAAEQLKRLTTRPDQWGQFKTPTLRNVATHPPYMHAGQFESLKDVLRYYSTLEGALPVDAHGEQVLAPLRLSDEETNDLLAFLEALTDETLDPALRRPPPEPK